MRFNLAFYADPRHFDSQVVTFRRCATPGRRGGVAAADRPDREVLRRRCHRERDRRAARAVLLRAAQPRDAELGGRLRWPRRHAGSTIWVCRSTSTRSAMRRCARRWMRSNMWRGATVPRDRRPVIAHAQLVDDADIGRFAELGVIPNMQPLWAQLDALMTVLTVPRLGVERADKQYRIRSIEKSGAPLAFGSDWPVSSGAPLDGIAVAVSRQTGRRRTRRRMDPRRDTPDRAGALRLYGGRGVSGVRRRPLGPDRTRRQRRSALAGPRPQNHSRRWSFPRYRCVPRICAAGRSTRPRTRGENDMSSTAPADSDRAAAVAGGGRPPPPRARHAVAGALRDGLHGAAHRVHHLRHRHRRSPAAGCRWPTW